MVYSDRGLNKMSQVYHRLYRKNLMRGQWKEQPRPILLNNWEATYFDFTEEKIFLLQKRQKKQVWSCLFWMTAGLAQEMMITEVLVTGM